MNILMFLLMITMIFILAESIYPKISINAVQVDRYWSVLDGYQQNPPTITHAHGYIGLKFTEDFKKLVYNVNVNNIDNITGIFLYSKGDNNHGGNMILDFLEEAKEVQVKEKFGETNLNLKDGIEVKGSVAVGGVTSDDLRGELNGKSLLDLQKIMLNGKLYVTVQTKDFPLGEITGDEFVPIDRFFPDISDFDWN
ncbi:MAG TPA: CHRD domain-containing protein [Nitrososphaeraceae archaeon]|nr:CHRD domain-containing protein [Nitrososphaeraceae archaeon]